MKNALVLGLILLITSSNSFGQEWAVYTTDNSGLSDDRILSIATAAGGTKWIGTNGSGVAVFDDESWTIYNTSNSDLPGDYVYAVAIDGSGNAWIGTTEGLVRQSGETMEVYTTSDADIPANSVRSLAVEGTEDVWLGAASGFDGGLARFDGSDWTDLGFFGLPDYVVNAIAVDENGDKWIGTRSGLTRFDGTDWVTYNASNSDLPNDEVLSIAVAGTGDVWVGTTEGAARFDGTTWDVYTTSNSDLPSNYVGTIAVDENDTAWIGTGGEFFGLEGQGLARFDGTTWQIYNTSNSELPDNTILSIAIDAAGNKWIGTNGGGLAAFNEGGIVGVNAEEVEGLPEHFELHQNYPNPFNPGTVITFTLRDASNTTLGIYNLLGQEVETLLHGHLPAGEHSVHFDASHLPSGTYFYRLTLEGADHLIRAAVKRMVLMR